MVKICILVPVYIYIYIHLYHIPWFLVMKRRINFCPWTLPDLSRFLICILYLLGEATGGSVFFSKCFLWLGCLQMAVDGTG